MIKKVRGLLPLMEITICLLFLVTLNFIYQYYLSQNLISSILFGVFGGVILFISIFLKNRKTRIMQIQMKELNKYASCVVFKLKSSQNVISSIKGIIELLEGQVKLDVQILIDHLDNVQEIKTEHFHRYKFPSINIFHQILEIKYFYGGRATDLFHQILKDMAFELKKRDELVRKKSLISIQIYLMTAIVASLPLVLKVLSSEIYTTFASMASSQIIITLFHLFIILHIHFLQKAKNDISIRA